MRVPLGRLIHVDDQRIRVILDKDTRAHEWLVRGRTLVEDVPQPLRNSLECLGVNQEKATV